MKGVVNDPAEAAAWTVGRRVAARRTSLGLGRDVVARRCGMSSAYLEYLEDQGGRPSASAVRRIAEALHTTVEHLHGEDGLNPELSLSRNRPAVDSAPSPVTQNHVSTPLTDQECHLLMGSVPVGRVAFVLDGPPVVLPVNFTLLGRDILIQTSATSRLWAHATAGGMTSFEVDDFDEPYRLGWSVLCHGPASRSAVAGPDDHDAERLVQPWIGNLRDRVTVVINPTAVSGRRIGMA